ncbi:Hypothetical predicted protein [Olea europaea subsp. europaea]|uniref:Uncharacterized protein n=1 Tax=Olea europaea subsp. europaea TaxID=158383 RepID=A0A8S0UF52_OLEEU|nr:Hypothetical predicted protein [Olea europaea subsp. europaea]
MQRVELSYYSNQSFVLNPKTLDFDLRAVGNMDYGVELEDKEDIEGNFGDLDCELMEEPIEVAAWRGYYQSGPKDNSTNSADAEKGPQDAEFFRNAHSSVDSTLTLERCQ